MEERIVNCGEIYRHFKGNLYQIVGVAKHSETMEQMVVYQALYGDYGLYVRPLEMFLSEVDHNKYPEVTATYRFTKLERPLSQDTASNPMTEAKQTEPGNSESLSEKVNGAELDEHPEAHLVNSNLMSFLDAKDYGEKLEVLYTIRKQIDNRLMSDIELSLDMPMGMGSLDERLSRVKDNLQTLAKFECNRLR